MKCIDLCPPSRFGGKYAADVMTFIDPRKKSGISGTAYNDGFALRIQRQAPFTQAINAIISTATDRLGKFVHFHLGPTHLICLHFMYRLRGEHLLSVEFAVVQNHLQKVHIILSATAGKIITAGNTIEIPQIRTGHG